MDIKISTNLQYNNVKQDLTRRGYAKDEAQSTPSIKIWSKQLSGCKKLGACIKKILQIALTLGLIAISSHFRESCAQTYKGKLIHRLIILNPGPDPVGQGGNAAPGLNGAPPAPVNPQGGNANANLDNPIIHIHNDDNDDSDTDSLEVPAHRVIPVQVGTNTFPVVVNRPPVNTIIDEDAEIIVSEEEEKVVAEPNLPVKKGSQIDADAFVGLKARLATNNLTIHHSGKSYDIEYSFAEQLVTVKSRVAAYNHNYGANVEPQQIYKILVDHSGKSFAVFMGETELEGVLLAESQPLIDAALKKIDESLFIPFKFKNQDYRVRCEFNEASYRKNNKTIKVITQTVFITGDNGVDLRLVTDKAGRVVQVLLGDAQNGTDVIPKEYLDLVIKTFKEIYKVTSTYSQYQATLVRKGLLEAPEFHLAELAKMIRNRGVTNFDMRVQFTSADTRRNEGIDAGGPRRDYYSTLIEGLADSPIFTANKARLMLPNANAYVFNNNYTMNPENEDVYKDLGALLATAYYNDGIILGRRFDKTIFEMIFSLSAEEVDQSFKNLSPQVMLRMIDAFIASQEIQGVDCKFVKEALTLYREVRQGKVLSNQEMEQVLMLADGAAVLPKEFYNDEDLLDCKSLEEILADPNLKRMFDGILPEVVMTMQCVNGSGLGSILPGIHAMAKGVKTAMATRNQQQQPYYLQNVNVVDTWNVVRRDSVANFSTAVQGSLDRKTIADSIRTDGCNAEIKKKADWLAKWIKNDATDHEIEILLKFISGSSSFPVNGRITINSQSQHNGYNPIAISHTCFSTIDLSPLPCGIEGCNDRTEQDFIHCVKTQWLKNIEGYQMC